MNSSILVTSDNFWIGGRETYLSSYSPLFTKFRMPLALMAERISNPQLNEIFFDAITVETANSERLRAWLRSGEAHINKLAPSVIWAQHYRLLPAIILSIINDIPLVTTFHGPPLSMSSALAVEDRLGAALALQYGAANIAVSVEIEKQLNTHRSTQSRLEVIPNSVAVQSPRKNMKEQRKHSTFKCVMLTRQQKLDHLREGVRFLWKLRQRHPAVLTVYTGITVRDDDAVSKSALMRSVARLLGRKWLLANRHLIKMLPHIIIKPLTTDTIEAIAESDVVLGMGRVALEALAQSKPTVLIGYNEVIDLIDSDNFSKFQSTNFSGRNQKPVELRLVVNKLVDELEFFTIGRSKLVKSVDIKVTWKQLSSLFESVIERRYDTNFRQTIIESVSAYQNQHIDLQTLYKSLFALLNDDGKRLAGMVA